MEKYTRNATNLEPIKKDPDLNKSAVQSYNMNPYKDELNPLELINISNTKL